MTILKQKRRETQNQVAANRTPRPSIKSQQPFDWATVSWGPISEPEKPLETGLSNPPADLYSGDQPPTYYRGKI